MTEDQHQKILIEWADKISHAYPVIKRLYHVPNGGKRNPREAKKFKAMGVRPGVPDLCLPVSRKGYHALYIELKKEKGRLTKSQKEWGDFLEQENNLWVVCFGWVDAARTIATYLNLPESCRP